MNSNNKTSLTAELTIVNKRGLHTRASAKFVQTASKFSSEIILKKGELEANGKSIMGILTLAAEQGSKVLVVVHGPDQEEALKELSDLINNGFGED